MISLRILVFLIMFSSIIFSSIILTILDIFPPQKDVRPLGKYYLNYSYFEHGNITRTAKSPEAVTAIVWDYRGLDTLFETTVFFLAVMGGLTLFRVEKADLSKTRIKYIGMTMIVKQATKILAVLIIAVSASIALHGHLTPGGGFQGGTALAIAPLLVLAAYSKYILEEHGLTYLKAILIRSISLSMIWIVVLMPALNGYNLMQNQPFYPGEIFNQLISGSLFFYNLLEYLAIGMGFTAVFLYLSIPEKIYLEELRSIESEKG